MVLIESLFDVRGGSLMSHTCESCNEPLDPESCAPVCEECATREED